MAKISLHSSSKNRNAISKKALCIHFGLTEWSIMGMGYYRQKQSRIQSALLQMEYVLVICSNLFVSPINQILDTMLTDVPNIRA
jgi:hypothetical protein